MFSMTTLWLIIVTEYTILYFSKFIFTRIKYRKYNQIYNLVVYKFVSNTWCYKDN